MRILIRVVAPLVATALLAQGLPAYADGSLGRAAAAAPAAQALPAAGSAGDRNLTAWIDQVEADPNKFDQNLEEECIQTGGPACSLDRAQIQRIPGEIQKLTESMVEKVTADKQLEGEVTADLTAQPAQTRSLGRAARGVMQIIKTVPNNKAVQALANRADRIGDITDNVSRLAYSSMGAQSTAAGETHYLVAASKVMIYSMPVFGDVFSLGEAILDPNMSTADRVESGVVASLSLIGTAAAFAGGPVGLAAAAVIGVGVAAYYAVKAVWGWIASGSLNWAEQPPTTPEDLYRSGAYLEWENSPISAATTGYRGTQQTADHSVAMKIPLTGSGQEGTVSQTLLVDSRWTAYNNGAPVTYKLEPYSGSRNVPQGLYERSTWGATNATMTVWQDGRADTQGCNVSSVKSYFDPTYYFFMCGPKDPVEISAGHPAVIRITYTYSLANSLCGQPPCVLSSYDVNSSSSLSVYTTRNEKVTLALPFEFAIVDKAAGPGTT